MNMTFHRGVRSRLAVSVVLAVATTGLAGGPLLRVQPASAAVEAWDTWLLESPDRYRVGPPPKESSLTTKRELRQLRRLQANRTSAKKRKVRYWNSVPATQRWTEIALTMIKRYKQRPPFAARALGLLHTAMYDALVAARDSRAAYNRRLPAKLDPRLRPLLRARGSTYVSDRAAVAGAAEELLVYLFPLELESNFRTKATTAIRTRLWAAVNYRTDVTRGRRLGRKVAQLFLARAASDGHTNTGVSSPRPDGEQYWSPAPPGREMTGGPVGTWQPWLMETQSQARVASGIPGPFAYGSPEFMTELQHVFEVQENLTEEQKAVAQFWDDGAGTFTPPGHWFDILLDLATSHDLGTPRLALASAALGATHHDASIAFFEAKYHWWSIRPVTAMRRLCDGGARLCSVAELEADPSLASYPQWEPYLLTPPFPAYPGGHSTYSGASGRVLELFFPEAHGLLEEMANQAAVSRLYGGIHYVSDNDDGLILGRWVADQAIRWTQNATP